MVNLVFCLGRRSRGKVFIASLTIQGIALGHVRLDAPNGGEAFVAGETVLIEWHVHLPHVTENWDLWYSSSGPEGPWVEIVMDLPPGDISFGAPHSFEWTVPKDITPNARVRVRQDNSFEKDYYDISDGDFAIETPVLSPGDADGDGDIDLVDFGEFQLCFQQSEMTMSCEVFDFDLDGDVDLVDFGSLQLMFSGPGI